MVFKQKLSSIIGLLSMNSLRNILLPLKAHSSISMKCMCVCEIKNLFFSSIEK